MISTEQIPKIDPRYYYLKEKLPTETKIGIMVKLNNIVLWEKDLKQWNLNAGSIINLEKEEAIGTVFAPLGRIEEIAKAAYIVEIKCSSSIEPCDQNS